MQLFRPTVEVLGIRVTPSAGGTVSPAGLAAPPGESAAGAVVGIAGDLGDQNAHPTQVRKVTIQDFHFVKHQDKASPS